VLAPDAPRRIEAVSAYAVAVLATLVWVGCVLPAGEVPGVSPLGDDSATPIHREAWLLVPALVLLVLVPVGMVLAPSKTGRLAILAATDGFVCLFAGLALTFRRGLPEAVTLQGNTVRVLVLLMYLVAVLSVIELWDLLLGGGRRGTWASKGLRLALALLALVLPAGLLVEQGQERASLLAPFLFVALSAGGARLSRTGRGLLRTGSVLHLALAAHVLITIRWTIFASPPPIAPVGLIGWVTLAGAAALASAALVQAVVLFAGPWAPAHSAAVVSEEAAT
jgi:hypothetical protein